MEEKSNERVAMRVSWVSIVINGLLTAFKLLAGMLAGSVAMISDAVHSASDVFSTFVVMAGVKLSGKKADARHPFGHERFECVAALLLAVMLGGTGLAVGWLGVRKIAEGNWQALAVPGTLALVAAVVSVAVKEAMYWYTHRAAVKIGSPALRADAWHHRSDALSSVGSFVGILGARLGLPVLDPIASIVICLFIEKAAISVFIDAVRRMTDESAGGDTERRLEQEVLEEEGVLDVYSVKTRRFGSRIYVEVGVYVNPEATLADSHGIAERVHDRVEQAHPEVKHCVVQLFPARNGNGFPECVQK